MIDKETMFIEELTIGTKGEAQGTKIAIDAHTKFKDMNNVENVEAPKVSKVCEYRPENRLFSLTHGKRACSNMTPINTLKA
ncbi:hypothetical protein [Salinicoccus sp. CNSTN-B1]